MTQASLMHYLVWPLVKFLVAFIIVQVIVAAMNWVERRLLGLIQARLGPNRVGWHGLLQIIADPIKFLLKEDIVPSSSEKIAYFLGPMLPLIPAFIVFCLIPFGPGPTFISARVNVGLLLVLALTSTGVYGIILGGWASNNKYSLMGGLRSAAQMVSYEVPFGLSIVGVLMICGSLDLVNIVRYQSNNIWNLFPQIVAAFIFFVSMNAENNRTPFDLPEAESELVAGYHTEYSAMKFAFFMLAEYSAMLVNSCLMTILFLGGWTLAYDGKGLTHEVLMGMGTLGGVLGFLIFFTKVMFFMLVYVWFRATFPRFRFDQLMDLGWKWMIPLALGNIFVTGIFVLAGQERLMYWIGLATLGAIVFYLTRKPAKRAVPAGKVVHAS
ncbi:MAG TPA: NADH-quinone oxidoreductase subunit NuoH [Gemmatimonadaceae bacterium]|nr:NADH-quinone oxidoreductase subunit NuoH [Thermoanaerobaculia bacterium]HXQ76852.1 NADH-quinone oxidoreductase subunit NuoH [Gemmatimonadaceae bacterium]